MTENQFKFDRDTVATNLKTPIVYQKTQKNTSTSISGGSSKKRY